MKKIQIVTLSALWSFSALFGADFSEYSQEKLVSLAGKVAPQDALSYRIEINKRLEDMTIKDAREFKYELHNANKANQSNMTQDEIRKYREAVRVEIQKQLDNMTVKEARAKGVLGQADYRHGKKCMFHDKQNHRNPNAHIRDE